MWIGFLVVLFASMAVIVVGWLGWQKRLKRNNFAGIRTPYTMANDEQWEAVHHFGAPYMILGGVAAFSAALAMFPFAVAGVLPDAFSASVLLVIALVIGVSGLVSWRKGVKAAKAHLAA